MPEHGDRGDDAQTAPDSQTADDSHVADEDDVRGLAEPETLVDGATDLEDEADLGSRLSTAASDPPSSWAGPDVPPSNKAR